MSKINQPQIADKFNELVGHFTELYKQKQSRDWNGSGRIKSTPTSEQQIMKFPRSTEHKDNSSLQQNDNKTHQMG